MVCNQIVTRLCRSYFQDFTRYLLVDIKHIKAVVSSHPVVIKDVGSSSCNSPMTHICRVDEQLYHPVLFAKELEDLCSFHILGACAAWQGRAWGSLIEASIISRFKSGKIYLTFVKAYVGSTQNQKLAYNIFQSSGVFSSTSNGVLADLCFFAQTI